MAVAKERATHMKLYRLDSPGIDGATCATSVRKSVARPRIVGPTAVASGDPLYTPEMPCTDAIQLLPPAKSSLEGGSPAGYATCSDASPLRR